MPNKSKPYGLMADCHLHNWSQFAGVDNYTGNTRLTGLLQEMNRCFEETIKAGGNTIYIAGDLFHVRGNIKPSVFNAAYEFFKYHDEVHWVIIAGNHDLETKVAEDKTSALTALGALENVTVVNEHPYIDDSVIAVPWIEDITIENLQNTLKFLKDDGTDTKELDLILHAPINGVFKNIANQGLDPEEISKLPVKNIYSGHFHSHYVWEFGNKIVCSIGSLAQFSFGEAGNQTGFLVVYKAKPQFFRSSQPEYQVVNLSEIDEAPYLRAYLKVIVDKDIKQSELEKTKKKLIEEHDCKGVIFQMVPKQVERSTAQIVKSGSSLEQSVSEYIKTVENAPANLDVNCLRILKESEMSYESK